MFKPPHRAVWLLLATATWTQNTAYAYSVPLLHDAILWERASSTCDSGFSPCTDTGLPSNFCCPNDAICDPLAGNTTVICCPLGKDCSQISPITCDIQKQNVDVFPDAPIKTTALNGNLGKCGDNTCCPFGYSCSSNKEFCVRNTNQNAAPLQNVPTTSATTPTSTATTSSPTTLPTTAKTTSKASTTSTTSTTSATSTDLPLTVVPQTSLLSTAPTASQTAQTSTTSATAAQTSTATNVQSTALSDTNKPTSSPSKASIAGGVVGGFAGVLLVSAALWFFCNRRRRRNGSPNMGGFSSGQPGTGKSSNSMTSFGNIINNPLNISISSPKPQNDALLYRSDFIRKPPPSRDDALPPVPAADAAVVAEGGVNGDNSRPVSNVSPLSTNEGSGLRLSPRPLTLRKSQQPQQQQQQQQQHPADSAEPSRESAMEMEINVGVDPRMFLDGGSFTVSPTATSPTSMPPTTMMRSAAGTPLGYEDPRYRDPRYLETMSTLAPPRPRRSQDRLTTFSGLMREANLDPQRPYVPQGTPDSRLR